VSLIHAEKLVEVRTLGGNEGSGVVEVFDGCPVRFDERSKIKSVHGAAKAAQHACPGGSGFFSCGVHVRNDADFASSKEVVGFRVQAFNAGAQQCHRCPRSMGAVCEGAEVMGGNKVARALNEKDGARPFGEAEGPVFLAPLEGVRFARCKRSGGGKELAVHPAGLGQEMGVVEDYEAVTTVDLSKCDTSRFVHREDGFSGDVAEFAHGVTGVVAAFVKVRRQFYRHCCLMQKLLWWNCFVRAREISKGLGRCDVAQFLVSADGVVAGQVQVDLKEGDFVAACGAFAVAIPEPRAAFVGEIECGTVLLLVQWAAVVARFGWTLKETEADE